VTENEVAPLAEGRELAPAEPETLNTRQIIRDLPD
jgi:hypothetical protein